MTIRLHTVGATMFAVFVVLKLTHTVNWSWIWVSSPIWIGYLVSYLILGLAISLGVRLKRLDIKEKK